MSRYIGFRIPAGLDDFFVRLMQKSGLTQSAILLMALERLILYDKHYKPLAKKYKERIKRINEYRNALDEKKYRRNQLYAYTNFWGEMMNILIMMGKSPSGVSTGLIRKHWIETKKVWNTFDPDIKKDLMPIIKNLDDFFKMENITGFVSDLPKRIAEWKAMEANWGREIAKKHRKD